MDVERVPSGPIEAPAEGGDFARSFLVEHVAHVLLAEGGIPPARPPWGNDLSRYAERLVMSMGGDPKRLLGRRQPRGVNPDCSGRRIRERIAAELKLLGVSRRELAAVLGGAEATHPTNVSHLLRDARQRRDLRRYTLAPELGAELARIRDPGERRVRRRYWMALGWGIDSTLADELMQIEHACGHALDVGETHSHWFKLSFRENSQPIRHTGAFASAFIRYVSEN